MDLNLLWGLLRTEKPYAKIGYFLCLWWNYSKKGFSISVTFFAHVMHLSRVLLQHLAKPQRELAVTWCHFPSNSSYSNDISSSSLMKHSPCGLYPALLLHGWKAWLSKLDCSDSHTSGLGSLLFDIPLSFGSNSFFWGWISTDNSLELCFHLCLLHPSQWYLQTPVMAHKEGRRLHHLDTFSAFSRTLALTWSLRQEHRLILALWVVLQSNLVKTCVFSNL